MWTRVSEQRIPVTLRHPVGISEGRRRNKGSVCSGQLFSFVQNPKALIIWHWVALVKSLWFLAEITSLKLPVWSCSVLFFSGDAAGIENTEWIQSRTVRKWEDFTSSVLKISIGRHTSFLNAWDPRGNHVVTIGHMADETFWTLHQKLREGNHCGSYYCKTL